MAVNTKKKIFISYRVRDTQAAAGRLADALKLHFDEDQIFMDIDRIEAGLEFSAVITKYLGSSDVMLAIIGPDWMGYNSETKTYRIHEKNDWVKTEIATAVRRKIRVIPVLLEGGQLPNEDLLPEELKSLLSRQSYEISNKRWKYDSDQLIELLKKLIEPKPVVVSTPPPPKSNIGVYALVGGLIIAAFFAIKIYKSGGNEEPAKAAAVDSPAQELQPLVRVKSVAGKWNNDKKKVTYIIAQTGSSLSVKAYSNLNLLMGVGTGSINEQSVQFNLTIKNYRETFSYPLKATLSADGNELAGSAFFSQDGKAYYEKVQLQKQE